MEDVKDLSQMEILRFKFLLDGKMMLQIYKNPINPLKGVLIFWLSSFCRSVLPGLQYSSSIHFKKKKIIFKSDMGNSSRFHCIYI